jgi:hypothetical protein
MGRAKMVKSNGYNKTMNERRVENECKRMQKKIKMNEK